MAPENIYEQRPWLNICPTDASADVEVPVKSVVEGFNEATDKWKNKTAIIFYGKKISYGELREKVDRLATALSDLGVKKGDRVALLLLNAPEHIIAFYAVIKLGAVVSAISPVYVSAEIRHQLVDGGADTLICQDMLYEAVEKTGLKLKNVILTNIAESLPAMKRFLGKSVLKGVYEKGALPDPEIFQKPGFHRLQDLIKNYPPNLPDVEINPEEDLVTLPYTGGTTGLPKGVMITHQNVTHNLAQWHAFNPILRDGQEYYLAYMPFYHVGGQVFAVMDGILHGYTLLILTTPDPDDILNMMIRYNLDFFFAAPTLFEFLKDYKKTERINWKKFRFIMSGADALHADSMEQFKIRTGTDIHEAYGQTEVTIISHFNPIGKAKTGSVGVPITSTLAAILDPEKDEFFPVGEKGEIAVHGRQVTKGYFNNPEATRASEAIIDGKRWWRTGDIGTMDEDGYFYIYDRKKDLIKHNGLWVYPREVEEVLKSHPDVKEVGVVGVPDEKAGQNIKAMVVLESDARGKISEADIMEYCRTELDDYKAPRIIEFVGEIPKTDIGKVSRRELREED